ncbi:unnamed protein product [Brassica oleracea var. botrytis]
MKSAKERPENLKLCRRSSSDLSAREVEVTEVKVEKLRKESESGSDFSNKMTALCLLNIQRQRMLHEEALGLEMKKGAFITDTFACGGFSFAAKSSLQNLLRSYLTRQLCRRVRLVKASGKKYDSVERSIISVTRRCLFILRTTKVKTTSSRFCSSEIKFCSQDLLGISYTPVKSRRLEWSFRRRSNNRYGTQRCCWSSSGSQHQQTENFGGSEDCSIVYYRVLMY